MTGPRGASDAMRAGTSRWVLALVLWVCFIWGHSLVPGETSSTESLSFVNGLRPAFELLGITETLMMTFIVRKTAHFLEYAVLGVISGGLMRRGWGRDFLHGRLSLLVAVVVPMIDETIQRFVPGREGQLRDVCIDLAGIAFGLLVFWVVSRHRARHQGVGPGRQAT